MIMKAIEAGSKTLFNIVVYTYVDVERNHWVIIASNVRLHVENLDHRKKVPKVNIHILRRINLAKKYPKKIKKMKSRFPSGFAGNYIT